MVVSYIGTNLPHELASYNKHRGTNFTQRQLHRFATAGRYMGAGSSQHARDIITRKCTTRTTETIVVSFLQLVQMKSGSV